MYKRYCFFRCRCAVIFWVYFRWAFQNLTHQETGLISMLRVVSNYLAQEIERKSARRKTTCFTKDG